MAWPPTTHQDVQDELSNAQGSFGSVAARLGVAESGTHRVGFIWNAGSYYSAAPVAASTAGVSLTASRLYLAPFYLHTPRNIDRVGFNVSTAGTAGHVARVGIWSSDSSGLPSGLVLDAGTASVAATGAQQVTVSSTLPAGLLWLGVTAQSGSMTGWSSSQPILYGTTSPTLLNTVTHLYLASIAATSAFSGLTGPFTSGTSSYPAVSVRAA